MRSLKAWVTALSIAVVAVACGGGKSTPDTSGGATASDLALELSTTQVDNSGTKSVNITVTAVDAARVAVKDVPVSIAVDNNAVLILNATKTDATGKVTGTASIGNDRSNRVITVTATSGALKRTAAFQVTGAKINATAVPTIVTAGAAAKIQYQMVDVNSNPMVGQSISISGSGLTPATGTTDIHGQYTYNYTAPATAGSLDVTAVGGGYTSVQSVLIVSAAGGGSIPAAVGPISSASVSANPSVVGVNTSTATNNQADIRAVFLGASNAPIRNVRVRFDLNGDANSVGGTFSAGTAQLYSDANGVVTTSYVPGTRSSPTNGLTVRACYSLTDFDVGTCPNQTLATLTVSSEALSVTVGADNQLTLGADGLTYQKRFVVLVSDAAGQAKADVLVTPSIDLLRYYKGYWSNDSGAWVQTITSPACPNEDLNRNGFLEPSEDGFNNPDGSSGNPTGNKNGQLDPRKADVLISVVGSNRTDANGMVILQIEYPRSVASWEDYEILASASGVAGTEGRDRYRGTLPVLAADVKDLKVTPPFAANRYGEGVTCSDPN